MPPVSLPLKGGTVSARAGVHTSIPQTATRLRAPIIRISRLHFADRTLERICCREKNAGGFGIELLAGVAALHLTSPGLRGTVRPLDHPPDFPCASSSQCRENPPP